MEYLKGIADGVTASGTDVSRVAATSIPDSTYTPITWTAENFDYGGWWASGTNIVVPAGAIPSGYTTILVILLGYARFATNGTGTRTVHFTKNGSAFANNGNTALAGEETVIEVSAFTTVAAADIITMEVRQSSGGALNVSDLTFSVVRFAPAT